MLNGKLLSALLISAAGLAAVGTGIFVSKVLNNGTGGDENGNLNSQNSHYTAETLPMLTTESEKITALKFFLLGKGASSEQLDINSDGKINISDLIILKKSILKIEETTSNHTTKTTETVTINLTEPVTEAPSVTQKPSQGTQTETVIIQPEPVQPPETQAPQPVPIPQTEPPATEPPATEPPQEGLTYEQSEILRLVNIERANAGLSPLEADFTLMQAAQVRANEIVQEFSHTRPDGSSCFTILDQMGISYSSCGENIAAGYSSPEQTVQQWMNSPGHRDNILNSSYTHLGVGYFHDQNSTYRYYWTQLFSG